MIYLALILYLPLSILILWTLYLANMSLIRTNNLAPHVAKLKTLVGYIGGYFNIFCNWTTFSLIFLQFPPVGTYVSDRLRHYNHGDFGWRTKLVKKVFEGMLDPFDPTGDHV